METPAVYDCQTEKLRHPDDSRFTVGRDGDVALPVAEPRGNRGGVHNVDALLAGVADEHATVEIRDGEAVVVPEESTSTVYVEQSPVDAGGRRVRNAETIVLGDRKSGLWEGYRLQLFL